MNPGQAELTFMIADVSLPVTITIVNDQDSEPNELFLIQLTIPSNPARGLRIGNIARADVTIEDDDSKKQFE